MLLTENQLRNLIKHSLIKKMINENEGKEKKGFVKNMLDILEKCKGKLDDNMWTDKSIDTQSRMLMTLAFHPQDDNVSKLLEKQTGIEKLKKLFYNSPLEILLTNLMSNKEILNPLNKVNPVAQKKDTRKPLIDLINDKSRHNEIVTRLVKTVAYRQKKNPVGQYRWQDYTSDEAIEKINDAFKGVNLTAPSSDTPKPQTSK